MYRVPLCVLAAMMFQTVPGGAGEQESEITHVTFVSGDHVSGVLVEQTAEYMVLDHDVLGRLTIPFDQVAATVGSASESTEESQDVTEEAQSADVAVSEWTSRLEVGFGSSSGNTDTQDFFARITSTRAREETVLKLDASYFYGASNGDRNKNKFAAGARNDWLMPESRWFYFGQGRYEYDEFQSWDQRWSGAGGIGYELVKRDDLTLTLRGGVGAVKEIGSRRNQIIPEGLLGGEFGWQISDRQRFEADTSVYPDFSETGEFRAISTALWSYSINDKRNLSLNFGLLNEYQSRVDPGIKHNDLKVYGGLGISF